VVSPCDAEVIYAPFDPGVVRSQDGGRTWRRRGAQRLSELQVSPHDADVLYARQTPGRWLISQDGGDHWEAPAGHASLGGLLVAWSPVDPRVVHVGYSMPQGSRQYPDTEFTSHHTADGGRSWAPVATSAGRWDFQMDLVIHPASPRLLLTAGGDDVLLSRDGGRTWRGLAPEPVGDRMLRVLVDRRDPQRLLAAGTRAIYALQVEGPLTPVSPPRTVASRDTARAAGSWEYPVKGGPVYSLGRSTDGAVWFVRGRWPPPYQVGYVQGDSAAIVDLPEDVARRTKPRLTPDPAGGMWCGTAHWDGQAWTDRTPLNELELTSIYTNNLVVLKVRANGEVWGRVDDDGYGTDGAMAIFEGDRGLFAEERYGRAMASQLGDPNHINVIEESPDGDLWIGTGSDRGMSSDIPGGLTRLHGGRWRFLGLQEGLAHPYVRDIAMTPEGDLWAATDGGITCFAPPYEFGTSYDDSNSALASRRVSAVAVDDSGAVWMGTRVGLSRFFEGYWTNYGQGSGMPPVGAVHDVLADEAGRVWAAGDSGIAVLTREPTAPVRLPTPDDPGDVGEPIVPDAFALQQNYPNPFDHETVVPFDLPRAARVELAVYSMAGHRVRTLLEALRPAGRHRVTWDGTDDDGRAVASGVYLCRLRSEGGVRTRRLVLMK